MEWALAAHCPFQSKLDAIDRGGRQNNDDDAGMYKRNNVQQLHQSVPTFMMIDRGLPCP
jgi:hypothetical protein